MEKGLAFLIVAAVVGIFVVILISKYWNHIPEKAAQLDPMYHKPKKVRDVIRNEWAYVSPEALYTDWRNNLYIDLDASATTSKDQRFPLELELVGLHRYRITIQGDDIEDHLNHIHVNTLGNDYNRDRYAPVVDVI